MASDDEPFRSIMPIWQHMVAMHEMAPSARLLSLRPSYSTPTMESPPRLTFSPDMHAPQYQKLFNDYEAIRNNNPAIKSCTSPIQREDPIFIPFYDTPQRSKDSRLGASGTQYEAHIPNETTQLTIDDVQSSNFPLKSPSRDHPFLPLLDPTSWYPTASFLSIIPNPDEEPTKPSDAIRPPSSTSTGIASGIDCQVEQPPNAHTQSSQALSSALANFTGPSPLSILSSADVPACPRAPVDDSLRSVHCIPEFFAGSDQDLYTHQAQSLLRAEIPMQAMIHSSDTISSSEFTPPSIYSSPIPEGSPTSGGVPFLPSPYTPHAATSGDAMLQPLTLDQRLSVPNWDRAMERQLWYGGEHPGQPPGHKRGPTRTRRTFASTSAARTMPSIAKRSPIRFPDWPKRNNILDNFFRDDANPWRRAVLDNILHSSFYNNDEMEPDDKGATDPITMGYGTRGRSIYGVFIEEVGKGEWKCLFRTAGKPCAVATVFKRFERAVEHVRSHLNHRPYKCPGTCVTGPSCRKRFCASQYLRDHVGRKDKASCAICRKVVLLQNMPRHNQLCHPVVN